MENQNMTKCEKISNNDHSPNIHIYTESVNGGFIHYLNIDRSEENILPSMVVKEFMRLVSEIESSVNKQKYQFGMKHSLQSVSKLDDPRNFTAYLGYIRVCPKSVEMKYSVSTYHVIMMHANEIPSRNSNEEEDV